MNKMKELYPTKMLSCHSFLTNVYTSHYYDGTIMVGYFFTSDRDKRYKKITPKPIGVNADGKKIFNKEKKIEDDPCEMDLGDIVEGDTSKCHHLINVAHTLKEGFQYFLGMQISNDFVNFEFSHEDDPGNAFFEMCNEVYDINDYNDFNLTFKEGFVSSHKMIAFVPSMCYCCT
jgi:hypothetical protein